MASAVLLSLWADWQGAQTQCLVLLSVRKAQDLCIIISFCLYKDYINTRQ